MSLGAAGRLPSLFAQPLIQWGCLSKYFLANRPCFLQNSPDAVYATSPESQCLYRGHRAPDPQLPDTRDVPLLFHRQCRSGVGSRYSLPQPGSHTLLAIFRSLTSKLCSTEKEVRGGSSDSCYYCPVLAGEHFFAQQNPLYHPQSIPKSTSMACQLRK